jgi:hypothetical protein
MDGRALLRPFLLALLTAVAANATPPWWVTMAIDWIARALDGKP